MVPMRDILHIMLHSNRSYPKPLVGDTPLTAAFGDMAMVERMKAQQERLLENLGHGARAKASQLAIIEDLFSSQSKNRLPTEAMGQ